MTDRMTEPEWVLHAVWWQIYPLGFVGADTTGRDRTAAHRLDHIVDFLDYAVQLGASGLALGPVFESSTHGYDTIDYYRIDPRLGTNEEFDQLIEECHRRGLRILLDGVFNHVGLEFGGNPAWLAANADGSPATFEGHGGLLALDHANSDVVDFVVGVMTYWLDRGVDGWRLDAAYAVPTAFWKAVCTRVRARFPDAYLVGEVIHGDYPDFVEASGLNSVTQYELWKAIWSGLNDGNLFELAHALTRHNSFLDTFVPWTFIGNHDVTRIASKLDDARHHAHALVILTTVGGTPAVYYGDEQAYPGLKQERVGGDDAVRPRFPAHPADLGPDGGPTYRLHQELIGLRRRQPWLHRARTVVDELTNTTLVYDVGAPGRTIRVLLTIGDDVLTWPAAGTVLAGPATVRGGTVTVQPHGWAIVG